ncbi:MAG: 2-C-methyl-D-erythritol 4-phosphate cytidylyltransferase [Deltaproteobacteria bacterium]|uniref:2-C-methyl-D-erythritol 4-phosphate cytidylyltransferase n=1 Tax=Candidatus Zymogenus saltonus TaxID=2844893 RepID=A0A9D8KDD7_9DELT|nr:2-C-methyl-D-erythritol 4-phosphate cytidylyltransferase [Candidatus Zymogenus saltonus]
MTAERIWGIVPAGGSGSRIADSGIKGEGGISIDGKLPKQFIRVGGVPILVKTLKALFNAGVLSGITVPVKEEYIGLARELIVEFGLTDRNILFVTGGETRQASVFNGLLSIEKMGGADIVLIHDAARPIIAPETVTAAVEEARRFGAAAVGVGATDSSVLSKDLFIESYVPREKLFSVQTPQVFMYDLIMEGHRAALSDGITDATDDAGLVLRMGKKVRIVPGSPENIKVTFRGDLDRIR